MYDVELFGYWWFEGSDFINYLFRKMQCNQNIIKPIFAFIAIASSYFGHFTGTREGLSGIFVQIATLGKPEVKNNLNLKKIKLISTLILFIMLWFLAVYNPSILSIIRAVAAPIIATYVYLMPVIFMKKFQDFKYIVQS